MTDQKAHSFSPGGYGAYCPRADNDNCLPFDGRLSRQRRACAKVEAEMAGGSLNGIGGAIEAGEEPIDAMRREWKEETGDNHREWERFAKLMVGSGSIIYFFKASVDTLPLFPSHNDIGEALEVFPYDVAIRTPTGGMIQNLKWLLPLAFEDAGTQVNAMAA